MKNSLTSQINAIAEAREILHANGYTSLVGQNNNLDDRLNDAGSTIAALNLNPDREVRIKELTQALMNFVGPNSKAFGPASEFANKVLAKEKAAEEANLKKVKIL